MRPPRTIIALSILLIALTIRTFAQEEEVVVKAAPTNDPWPTGLERPYWEYGITWTLSLR